MNKILLILAGSMFLLVPPPGQAQTSATGEPKELEAIRTRYQADLQFAVKPVQSRYVSQLQGLIKTLTQKGDLAGALVVMEELKKIDPQAVAPSAAPAPAVTVSSPFSGTKWLSNVNGESKVDFRADGTWEEEWNNSHSSGTWKVTADRKTVEVTRNGQTLHYKMGAGGKSCVRQEGPLPYGLVK